MTDCNEYCWVGIETDSITLYFLLYKRVHRNVFRGKVQWTTFYAILWTTLWRHSSQFTERHCDVIPKGYLAWHFFCDGDPSRLLLLLPYNLSGERNFRRVLRILAFQKIAICNQAWFRQLHYVLTANFGGVCKQIAP